MPKDKKKDKKPRKPRAKKEKKVTQKQTQKQVVNIHLGSRGRPRATPTPKPSLPQTIIRMNEPPQPLPLQQIPPLREPLKDKSSPSKLLGLSLSTPFAEAYPTPYEAELSSIDGGQPARRGRRPLDPAVVKYRKELAEIEKAKKRMEREQIREAREAARPLPRPRGRPRKEGAKEKEGAATESGYEN